MVKIKAHLMTLQKMKQTIILMEYIPLRSVSIHLQSYVSYWSVILRGLEL